MTIGTGLVTETETLTISGVAVKATVKIGKFTCDAKAHGFTINGVTIASSCATGTTREDALKLLRETLQQAINTGNTAETDFSWAIVEQEE